MPPASKIGVLLRDQTSGEPIGIIEFNPSGMMISHIIQKGLHVFALKSVQRFLNEQVVTVPLYTKHEHLLKDKTSLPVDILEQEASLCADALNRSEQPLTVGKHTVKAETVHYS
jgi:hypothetical protein